jgi:23S rRNA pseudouridine2605 synthase
MTKKRPRDEARKAGPGPERIQKILAGAGFGSRRACEILIQQGRVRVDGEIVKELGSKADIEVQELRVDNKRVMPERPVYYLLNKPKGTLCTLSDPEGRRTVADHLPDERRRVFPVGRLDMDSRGAVILTNDGRFTNLLTHPRYGVEKTYLARVRGSVSDGALGKLRAGVWLAEGKTLPAKIWIVKRKPEETELGIAISEGKNRQVRRMLAQVGYKCLALSRTRVGPLTLKGLREGDVRELTKDEVAELEKIARRNAGAPPPPWARGRSSRARAKGKPDPRFPVIDGVPSLIPQHGPPPSPDDELEGDDVPARPPIEGVVPGSSRVLRDNPVRDDPEAPSPERRPSRPPFRPGGRAPGGRAPGGRAPGGRAPGGRAPGGSGRGRPPRGGPRRREG